MKTRDMDVELVTEYAKKLTWQKRHNTLKDQMYVTAKQNHRMTVLQEQVEFCITDSPIILGMFYSPTYYPNTYPAFMIDVFNSYENINFWIDRTKKYNPKGRNESEEEAREADRGIQKVLNDNNIPYTVIKGDATAPQKILEEILKK